MIEKLVVARERPKILSKRWFVVWLKRLVYLPDVFMQELKLLKFRTAGALVGDGGMIEAAEFVGSLKNLRIGNNTFIGRGAYFVLHDSVVIGNNVVINEGVRILTASHRIDDPTWPSFTKKVEIGSYAWVAMGATLLPGVRVSEGAVVGAGAVVTHDVPPYTVVAGNPAKKISNRADNLNYDPVRLCAPYEAWYGKSRS